MLIVLIIEFLAFISSFLYIYLKSKKPSKVKQQEIEENSEYFKTQPEPFVDIYIATYNEPINVLKKTIFGAKGLDYSNYKIYVLDDGRREEVKNLCKLHEVNYITRKTNENAKAGNLNNALQYTNGEYITIVDADFILFPNFLKRTMGFFRDKKIALLQVPHHFYNKDPLEFNSTKEENFADEQRFWFDDMLEARDNVGVATSCGSCSILKREVLKEIGGVFPTETITEDYDLSLRLLEKGYITKYVNERLAIGLAAENLKGFFIQRKRWAKGNIQVWKEHFKRKNYLSLKTYLYLFDWYYFIQIPTRLFLILLPIFYFYFGLIPLEAKSVIEVLQYNISFLILNIILINTISKNKYLPFLTNAINFACIIRIFPEVLKTFIKPFGGVFEVTPKGELAKGNKDFSTKIVKKRIQIFAWLLLFGIFYISYKVEWSIDNTLIIAIIWAITNLISLFFAIKILEEKTNYRIEERMDLKEQVILKGEKNLIEKTKTIDVSINSLLVEKKSMLNEIQELEFLNIKNIKVLKSEIKKNKRIIILDLTPEQEFELSIKLFNKNKIPVKYSNFKNYFSTLRKLIGIK